MTDKEADTTDLKEAAEELENLGEFVVQSHGDTFKIKGR